MERWILHCDCNSFYASVEHALNPALGEGPMAVAGDPKARHGIILAKNEAAKKYGIQTAETVWQAKRKCPQLLLVPPHFQAYEAFSARLNAIYADYTDLVEPFSIDESFLDVSGTLHLFGCDAKELADRIRHRVKQELAITISAGVSFNKTFAKLGSDMKKPDATTFLPREAVAERIHPLPVSSLLYVGRASEEKLARLNIRTIGDLAAADPMLLYDQLGKAGLSLSRAARGEDKSPVLPPSMQPPLKSVGNGLTFPEDLQEQEALRRAVILLAEGVSARLRTEKMICSTVQISWKTPDLQVHSKQGALDPPCRLTMALSERSMALLKEGGAFRSPIRSLTVTACHLLPEDAQSCQLSLFEQQDRRREKAQQLEETLFAIRDQFGDHAVKRALFTDSGEKK